MLYLWTYYQICEIPSTLALKCTLKVGETICINALLWWYVAVNSKKIEETNFGHKNHVLMTLHLFWIEIMKLKLPEKLGFVSQFVWFVWIIDLFMLLKGLHTYLTCCFRVA